MINWACQSTFGWLHKSPGNEMTDPSFVRSIERRNIAFDSLSLFINTWTLRAFSSPYFVCLHPIVFPQNLRLLAPGWSWRPQFGPAHMLDQVKTEIVVCETPSNRNLLGVFNYNWDMMTEPWLSRGSRLSLSVCCNQPKSVLVCLCFGERSRIFVLLQFQTVSFILVHPVQDKINLIQS